jgi:xanthine dehydrogenase accessory factor
VLFAGLERTLKPACSLTRGEVTFSGVRDVTQALLEVLDSGRRGALATVVRVSGSTPQQPGARLLLRPDGTRVGTVGGGALEHLVERALEAALTSGSSEFRVLELGHELGMCCGGRMEIFIEPIEASPRLFLFGAGHVAKATAAVCRSIGFRVTVVDERETLATSERFPGCELELRDPSVVLAERRFTGEDWLLIMTHDHRLDQRALELSIEQRPRYIGLVGSRRKVFRLLERITLRRGSELALDRVYAPVGLDLGAVGPEEIAVSIASEMIALRRGKAAPHLRAVEDLRLQRALAELSQPAAVSSPRPLTSSERLP